MSLSWINFVTSGNIGFASARDGPLENLLGGGGPAKHTVVHLMSGLLSSEEKFSTSRIYRL